jgi:hypothetical protein
MYFDKNHDIRYFRSDIDTISNLAHVKFDFFKSKQIINEEKFHGEVFLPNSKPGYYLEQLLPNNIPDIPICDEKDSIYVNNNCTKCINLNKADSNLVKDRECLLYDEEGYCSLCGSGKNLFNRTCIEYCPYNYMEYFKICYPCKKECDLNNVYMLIDCESCKKNNSIKHIQYSTFESNLDNSQVSLNQISDENRDNFFIEIFMFIPEVYSILDFKEYLLFSLSPFQITMNNSLALFKYIKTQKYDKDPLVLAVKSLDFKRWNYIVFEQNANQGKINIYLNTFIIQTYNLTTNIKNSLDVQDLLVNYNYGLSYYKFLRIWGKNTNIDVLNFYWNYNL